MSIDEEKEASTGLSESTPLVKQPKPYNPTASLLLYKLARQLRDEDNHNEIDVRNLIAIDEYDFCLVFPNIDDDNVIKNRESVLKKLHRCNFITFLFLSNDKKLVFCKIKITMDHLMHAAGFHTVLYKFTRV